MSWWKSFLKQNLLWILLVCAILSVQYLYQMLIGVSVSELNYELCIGIFLLCIVSVWKMYRSHQHLEKTRKMTQMELSGVLRLPEPEDADEICYQQLIERLNEERVDATRRMEVQQQDMQSYYDLWVHQIKTPIAGMKLMLQVAKDGIADENQYESVSELEEELFVIENYVGMALQYQRMTSSHNDFVLRRIELDTVIRGVIRRYAKMMIRKHLRICYEGTGEQVCTDEKWLAFVLEQLLSNAIKYSKEGTITIEVRTTPEKCEISLRDEGIGIRSEDIPRVCEKGYTGYNGHADKYSTGIGLYLCSEMLKKLGHKMRIESELDRGTTVTISINTNKIDYRD